MILKKCDSDGTKLISNKEVIATLIFITIALVVIAVGVILTLTKVGPPDKETYIFPSNTYTCVMETTDNGETEKICALRGPSATFVEITPSLPTQTEVNK